MYAIHDLLYNDVTCHIAPVRSLKISQLISCLMMSLSLCKMFPCLLLIHGLIVCRCPLHLSPYLSTLICLWWSVSHCIHRFGTSLGFLLSSTLDTVFLFFLVPTSPPSSRFLFSVVNHSTNMSEQSQFPLHD